MTASPVYVEPSISTGVRIGLAKTTLRAPSVDGYDVRTGRFSSYIAMNTLSLCGEMPCRPLTLLYSPFWLNMYSSLYCQRAALSLMTDHASSDVRL